MVEGNLCCARSIEVLGLRIDESRARYLVRCDVGSSNRGLDGDVGSLSQEKREGSHRFIL